METISIIVDSREQAPYLFDKWPEVTATTAGLPTGDYSIQGFEDKAAVERKELNDLVACLMGDNRTRFEKELARLRAYELKGVVVEASMDDIARGRYQSQMKPAAALQSIFAMHVRYGVSFLFCGSRESGEYTTYSLLSKYLHEIQKRYDMARKCATK